MSIAPPILSTEIDRASYREGRNDAIEECAKVAESFKGIVVITPGMMRRIEREIHRGGYAYIYGLQCGEFIKIGMARNVARRLEMFKLHNPFECKVVLRKFVEDCRWLEIKMHELLSSKRHRGGGWFMISPKEARETFRAAFNERAKRMRKMRLEEWEKQKRATSRTPGVQSAESGL